MRRSGDAFGGVMATSVALLMLALSVAVPMLERADIVTAPVAESEHNPATCPPAHDHTVCTQVSSNLAAPSPGHERRLAGQPSYAPAVDRLQSVVAAPFFEGHPSRAPPRA